MYKRHEQILPCWHACRKTIKSSIIFKMAETVIPIVDLNDLASSPKEASSLEFTNALRKHGIMYIRNHGIPQELVSNCNCNPMKSLFSHATLYLVIEKACRRGLKLQKMSNCANPKNLSTFSIFRQTPRHQSIEIHNKRFQRVFVNLDCIRPLRAGVSLSKMRAFDRNSIHSLGPSYLRFYFRFYRPFKFNMYFRVPADDCMK